MSARERLEKVTSSLMWSAWADALGFISELTDEAGVTRRTRGRPLTEVMDWHRQVGGRYGVRMLLPAGTYSDDTQLRLGVARAISNNGFDVEAFARVELTLWPSYALGGGRASKAAASAMARSDAHWSANFYDGWLNAGGNGAAMRIQPHVYAAADLGSWGHLADVVRDSIVTHGHPRALVGAVMNAAALTLAMRSDPPPPAYAWEEILEVTRRAVSFFYEDHEVGAVWTSRWEAESRRGLDAAWQEAVGECEEMLARSMPAFARLRDTDPSAASASADAYGELAHVLRLHDEELRGSGTSTVVAAILLAQARPQHPSLGAVLAAGEVGTDTDTIATMAAALVGAARPVAAPPLVQDAGYLSSEAQRLARIGAGRPAAAFPYPDLLHWSPPQSQLESVGYFDGQLVLSGMGWLTPISEAVSNKESSWTWMNTSVGPTMLLKHRRQPRDLRPFNGPSNRMTPVVAQSRPPASVNLQPELFDLREDRREAPHAESLIDLAELVEGLDVSDDASVGKALRQVAAHGNPAQVTQFAKLIKEAIARAAE